MKPWTIFLACAAALVASAGADAQVPKGSNTKAPATGTKTITATAPSGGAISGGGLDCGAVCNATATAGGQVTFFADPAVGFAFESWDGACKGQGESCSVAVNDNITFSARFKHVGTATLTVSPAPVEGDVTASYMLSGTNAGVSCKAGKKPACSAKFTKGTELRIRASDVSSGYKFGAWTGACAGKSATCQLIMDKDHTISATFVR
jgi:hypothetical protein